MSGFDFDALRDPDAPQPGARERTLVDARAVQLRARARRNRLVAGATAIVAATAIVFGVVASTRSTGPSISVEGGTTTVPTSTSRPASSVDGRFVPPTSIENGMVVLPVTFPDGETTTLHYPEAMRIAQLGFATGAGVGYAVSDGPLHCCGKVVSIRYATIAQVYGDATPVKTYRDAEGRAVPFFHASQAIDPPNTTKQDFLVFQFGPWLVAVYDVQHSGDFELRMTDAQRATWARSLTGTVDANGYLVLHARAPLSIDQGSESGFGADPADVVELDPHLYCGEPGSDTAARRRGSSGGTHGVSWCVGNNLHVSASGTATFADLAATKLQVSPLTPPPGTTATSTTTTTTTVPAAPRSPAVSASFVSAQQGWVLRRDGSVDQTTDGGASWHAVGSLGRTASDRQIRFADAARGFSYSVDPQSGAPLLTTSDGGAHWTTLRTSFASPFALAISRGVVYAVAMQPSDAKFRIWSSPADAISWKEDPLVVDVGAGPIPEIQLVFAGNEGWLVEVDRVVTAGARLGPKGDWSAWRPPCTGVNGPAELTASTSNDLFASCQEGVWGPPAQAAALYVSHDGGATFQRHLAPGFGPLGSPNPNTAVVATPMGLQRSVDSGVTWHAGVAAPNADGATEIGFTTPTQGYWIAGDRMLMTYDAGATWRQVTP